MLNVTISCYKEGLGWPCNYLCFLRRVQETIFTMKSIHPNKPEAAIDPTQSWAESRSLVQVSDGCRINYLVLFLGRIQETSFTQKAIRLHTDR